MEFYRQEYWSGLQFPSPAHLSNPGIEPGSPALAGKFFATEPPGNPIVVTQLYVLSHFLRPHALQHARLLCTTLSPRVCSNSCPLSQWCYLTISSPVALFFFSFQSFPASGSFLMSWLFTSPIQSIGASVSATVLPMNIRGLFPLGMTGLISLHSKGHKSLLKHNSKAPILQHPDFFMEQLSHPYMMTG